MILAFILPAILIHPSEHIISINLLLFTSRLPQESIWERPILSKFRISRFLLPLTISKLIDRLVENRETKYIFDALSDFVLFEFF